MTKYGCGDFPENEFDHGYHILKGTDETNCLTNKPTVDVTNWDDTKGNNAAAGHSVVI
jgi:hypothetical protein